MHVLNTPGDRMDPLYRQYPLCRLVVNLPEAAVFTTLSGTRSHRALNNGRRLSDLPHKGTLLSFVDRIDSMGKAAGTVTDANALSDLAISAARASCLPLFPNHAFTKVQCKVLCESVAAGQHIKTK